MPLSTGVLAVDAAGVLAAIAAVDPAALSDRELVLAGGVVLASLYLAYTAVRGGPSRDRKGRFRSKRRGQFLGLLKIGVVVALLWLATSMLGLA